MILCDQYGLVVSTYLNIMFSLCTIALTGAIYTTRSETTMNHTQETIKGAIARSISHDEIVTVTVDDIDAAFADLTAETEDDYDHVDTRGGYDAEKPMREVWSTDAADGNDWRVHLVLR